LEFIAKKQLWDTINGSRNHIQKEVSLAPWTEFITVL